MSSGVENRTPENNRVFYSHRALAQYRSLSKPFHKYTNVFCAKRLGVRCANTALIFRAPRGRESGDDSPQSKEASPLYRYHPHRLPTLFSRMNHSSYFQFPDLTPIPWERWNLFRGLGRSGKPAGTPLQRLWKLITCTRAASNEPSNTKIY